MPNWELLYKEDGVWLRFKHEGAAPENPQPCPFCRSDAVILSDPAPGLYATVGCDSGNCHIRPFAEAVTLEEAFARWNDRPDDGTEALLNLGPEEQVFTKLADEMERKGYTRPLPIVKL